MRVSVEQREFLARVLREICPSGEAFLFGSRVDDGKRGGDIDVLLLSPRKLPLRQLIKAKLRFFRQFGEQKLDLVNLRFDDSSPFKRLILAQAVKLS